MKYTELDMARWWAKGWSRKWMPHYGHFEYCESGYVLQRTMVADRRFIRVSNVEQAAQAGKDGNK